MATDREIEELVSDPQKVRDVASALLRDEFLPSRLEAFVEKLSNWPNEWMLTRPQATFLLELRDEQRLVSIYEGIRSDLLVEEVWGGLADGGSADAIERVARLRRRTHITMRDFGWLLAVSRRMDGLADVTPTIDSDAA